MKDLPILLRMYHLTAEDLQAPLGSLADRAWYAWLCLARGPDGDPPSFRSLEEEYGIPEGTISKLVRGIQKTSKAQAAHRLAQALHVPPEWLFLDTGAPGRPWLTGPYRPRPGSTLIENRIEKARDALLRLGFEPHLVLLALVLLGATPQEMEVLEAAGGAGGRPQAAAGSGRARACRGEARSRMSPAPPIRLTFSVTIERVEQGRLVLREESPGAPGSFVAALLPFVGMASVLVTIEPEAPEEGPVP